MREKCVFLCAFVCLISVISVSGQAPGQAVKDNSAALHVYIGAFIPPDYPLTAFAAIDGATVNILRPGQHSIVASAITDARGYVRIVGIQPGEITVAVQTLGRDYLLKGQLVELPLAGEAKVFLHLQQGADSNAIVEEASRMGVLDLLPNLQGSLVEVGKSRAVIPSSFASTKDEAKTASKDLKKK